LGRKTPEAEDAVAALTVRDAVIDGEIVALDDKGRSSFQLLQGFDMGLVRLPIVFYVLDLLQLNGKDLQGLPIEERKAKQTRIGRSAARSLLATLLRAFFAQRLGLFTPQSQR
jgi:bifunctional non-homologous end joining protein LigD